MKLFDILLSTMIHAGLVAGVMYGSAHYDEEASDEVEMAPIFFEILEENVIASASQAETTNLPPEKETEFSEDEVRPEFTEEEDAEAVIQQSEESEAEKVEDAEEPEVHKEEKPAEVEPMESEKAPQEPEKAEQKAEAEIQETEVAQPSDIRQAKVVSVPMALNRIVPSYPRSARRRGREGIVTLEIVVSGSGAVSRTDVIGSSGHSDLDSAAVSAVKTARFAPATEDGVQVEGKLRLTFEFKLK